MNVVSQVLSRLDPHEYCPNTAYYKPLPVTRGFGIYIADSAGVLLIMNSRVS